MQKRFLDIDKDIKDGKLTNIVGLWLVCGDEPLVQDWLIDAFRPIFNANRQVIQRLELTSPKSWQAVIGELSSLSLFGDNTALIVSGKQKCDDKTLAELAGFADEVRQGNSQHCLIYQLPKQDKKAQSGKLYQLFAKNGVVADCEIYNEKDRKALLVNKANDFGLTLDNDAWAFLLAQTENHLLSAYQALWRAYDLYANQDKKTLQINELMPILVSDYQYSVFELCDTLLLGNAQKAVHILNHLKQTDTAPSVILWAIVKEVRLILQLQAGKSFGELGIWQSKFALYQTAQNRPLSPQVLDFVYKIDQSIKGIDTDNVWGQLTTLCLWLCGVPYLRSVR